MWCREYRGRKETKNREKIDGVRIAIIFCHWPYYVPVIHSFCHSSLELGNPVNVYSRRVFRGKGKWNRDKVTLQCVSMKNLSL
jgi:hypothetical protein